MKCTLSDIAEVTMGQSPKSEFYNTEGVGIPFLQGNRTFGRKYPVFDTYTTRITKMAKAGDVIMSVRAPVGELNITPVDICLGRGVCGIRMKNGNQDFLFYLLKYYMPHLLNKESGTVFGSVNKNDINGLEIEVPDNEDDEVKISRYLTMFDNKIELNVRINKNLEEQAQTLFYQLYNTLEGSQISLSEIVEVRDGTHSSPRAVEKGYPLITSKNLRSYTVDKTNARIISQNDYDKINERSQVDTGDVLISMIGTVGIISYITDSSINYVVKNVGIFKTSQNPLFKLYILEYLKSNYAAHHIEKSLAGSTQKYISLGELRKIPVRVPPKEQLIRFNNTISPLFSKLSMLHRENETLRNIRDALLPKLISGEIDISNIKV